LRNPSRVDFVGTHVREPASLAHDAEERPYPKEQFMQKVLIDIFVVPEESRLPFLERSRKVQSFLKTLPGFVEGFLYERKKGESRYNYLTIATWENEEAFENAKAIVAAEFKKQGYDREAAAKKLKIESQRAVYERSPY
jgi:heme-degrading monooxygenase HmoA